MITVSLSSIEAASVSLSRSEKFQLSVTGVNIEGFLKVVKSGISSTIEKNVTVEMIKIHACTYKEKRVAHNTSDMKGTVVRPDFAFLELSPQTCSK